MSGDGDLDLGGHDADHWNGIFMTYLLLDVDKREIWMTPGRMELEKSRFVGGRPRVQDGTKFEMHF